MTSEFKKMKEPFILADKRRLNGIIYPATMLLSKNASIKMF